jgi:hypothetical protein
LTRWPGPRSGLPRSCLQAGPSWLDTDLWSTKLRFFDGTLAAHPPDLRGRSATKLPLLEGYISLCICERRCAGAVDEFRERWHKVFQQITLPPRPGQSLN